QLVAEPAGEIARGYPPGSPGTLLGLDQVLGNAGDRYCLDTLRRDAEACQLGFHEPPPVLSSSQIDKENRYLNKHGTCDCLMAAPVSTQGDAGNCGDYRDLFMPCSGVTREPAVS